MDKWKRSVPRRKRMNRKTRLQAAKRWVAEYPDMSIVRAYAKWYGVDMLCAISELQTLGITLADDYLQQIKLALAARQKARENRKRVRLEREHRQFFSDTGESFAFAACHIGGSIPYGVTWEGCEAEEECEVGEDGAASERSARYTHHDDIPF